MAGKILGKGFSADKLNRARIADDDELAAAFSQVIAAAAHLKLKPGAADPRFDIADGAADHAAFFGHAGGKNLLQPLFRIKGLDAPGHGSRLAHSG
ncbi:MAG: hypothetical protein K8F59_12470 [Rhodobacteraceae bacterium]|nr:hypothetical protein [Paracoccaceae bacterium]